MWIDVEGARVYAQTGGMPFEPTAPVAVLMHGAGLDHTIWQQQTRYLAHHGPSVLALDLPGHGRSEGDPKKTIEDLADWTVHLLDAAGVGKATLGGHSMGALGALETAARHGERIAALILAGATPAMPVHQDLLDAATANDHRAVEFITGWGFGTSAHRGGNIAPGIWMMGGGARLLERTRPGVIGIDLASCADYQNGLAAAGAVSCPTLLLLGQTDRMTPPRNAQSLQEAIPDCRTVILPDTGHMMMIEAPRDCLKAMASFLDSLN